MLDILNSYFLLKIKCTEDQRNRVNNIIVIVFACQDTTSTIARCKMGATIKWVRETATNNERIMTRQANNGSNSAKQSSMAAAVRMYVYVRVCVVWQEAIRAMRMTSKLSVTLKAAVSCWCYNNLKTTPWAEAKSQYIPVVNVSVCATGYMHAYVHWRADNQNTVSGT